MVCLVVTNLKIEKMKKISLFILIIPHFIINSSLAQNFLKKNIEEVTITSNRSMYNEEFKIIHTIDAQEIKSSANQTIADILEFAINIDNRERGGQGVQSDISIRGGTFEQTLILINGIKMNDPQTGHHNLNIPISPELIERIEITTGGATRIYGNYAYSGVINIITKENLENSLILSKGQNNFNHGEINFNLPTKNFNQIFHFSNKNSDGYYEGTDYRMYNFYYQIKTKFNDIKSTLNTGINKKDFGAYNFYSTKYPNQFEKTKTTFASLNINKKGDVGFNNNFYWRMHEDEFILFRDNPSLYQNFHKTNVIGLDLNIIKKTQLGTFLVGAEMSSNSILSNNLGEDLNTPILISGDNYFNKADNRTVTNLFLENNVSLKRMKISAGIMLNINSTFGNEWFPGLDINYKISKNLNCYLSINKSMRTPNFTELYYTSPTNEGNINLVPEQSISKEIGFKAHKKTHTTSIAIFERNGNNLIDWILFDGDSIWRTQNLNKIKTTGVELNSKINLKKIFNSKINYFKIMFASNNVDTISDGFRSAYVLDHLKTNLSFSINHNITNNISLDWKMSYQERIGDYLDPDTETFKNFEPFWLTSLRLTKDIKSSIKLFLDINNFFDVKYSDFGTIDQPGRWARVGLKAKI